MKRKREMTKMNIEKIKKELEEKRDEFISFLKPSQENEKIDLDDYELAHHYQLSEQQNSLNSHNQNILLQIENSLQKIENGTYGMCDKCGMPIDPDRLKILPYANFCVDCLNRFPSKLIDSTNSIEK